MSLRKQLYILKKKQVSKSEKKNRVIARKSVVAAKKIHKGEKFTINNLAVKRPGNGLSPENIFKLLGKKSLSNYKKDDFIK